MAEDKKVGCTVKDVAAQPFIAALAQHFKKSGKIELPEWHDLIKTSIAKELPPRDPDWYYIRAASLARKVYLRGGSGVGGFTKAKGGANKDGVAPAHFRKAAKGNIRHILKQLASADIVYSRRVADWALRR